MTNTILFQYNNTQSRLQLLLRGLFALYYISIPHLFFLVFLRIIRCVYAIFEGIKAIFTGKISDRFIKFQSSCIDWHIRWQASIHHMIDGYPAISLTKTHPNVIIKVNCKNSVSRGLVLLRLLFIPILITPHSLVLIVMALLTFITTPIVFVIVLISGQYPKFIYKFHVNYLALFFRVEEYTYYLTDIYPVIFASTKANNANVEGIANAL